LPDGLSKPFRYFSIAINATSAIDRWSAFAAFSSRACTLAGSRMENRSVRFSSPLAMDQVSDLWRAR
jgi:hypothetical protein